MPYPRVATAAVRPRQRTAHENLPSSASHAPARHFPRRARHLCQAIAPAARPSLPLVASITPW
eukprot:1035503-Prymnesium_polylepis.1